MLQSTSFRVPLCILIFASQTLAKTWWIDGSCETYFGPGIVDSILVQTVSTATLVKGKLDVGDPDMMQVFSTLMSFEYGAEDHQPENTWFDHIIGLDDGLTLYQPAGLGDAGWAQSNLRVHCDNGAHWNPRDDKPGEFEDSLNKVWATENACQTNPKPRMAVTADGELEIGDGSQNAERYILDVCDTEENREAAHLVPRLKRQGRLTNIDTEAPEHLAAMGLFNSVGSMWSFMKYTRSLVLTHALRPGTDDHAYGWSDSVALVFYSSVRSADNYLLLGAAHHFSQQGYKLYTTVAKLGDLLYDGNAGESESDDETSMEVPILADDRAAEGVAVDADSVSTTEDDATASETAVDTAITSPVSSSTAARRRARRRAALVQEARL